MKSSVRTPKRTQDERRERETLNLATILLLLALLLFILLLINFATFDESASGRNLPVSIRATSRADYSRDPVYLSIPPISLNILNQLITDIPATGDPNDRLATLAVSLLSPVPTATLDPNVGGTSTAAPGTSIPQSTAILPPTLESPPTTNATSPPPVSTPVPQKPPTSAPPPTAKSRPTHPVHPPSKTPRPP